MRIWVAYMSTQIDSGWPRVRHNYCLGKHALRIYVVMETTKHRVYVIFWPTAVYGHKIYSI